MTCFCFLIVSQNDFTKLISISFLPSISCLHLHIFIMYQEVYVRGISTEQKQCLHCELHNIIGSWHCSRCFTSE